MDGYQRDGKSGLYLPKKMAIKIGIGCPKCDDHFLQDVKLGQTSTVAQRFIQKHKNCGQLQALELVAGGKLVCTGPVALKFEN